jgi:predicted deacylase
VSSVVRVGDIICGPGEIQFGGVSSVGLRDGSMLEIPLIVVNGVEEGPTLWLGAFVHGDEMPGWEVVRRVVREKVDPQALRGTILACPAQNPLSYVDSNRWTPQDGININRVFPGKRNGSVTERLAYDLFHEGVAKADVVLDLHSIAGGGVSFNVVKQGGQGPAWDEQWPLARAFGIPIAVFRSAQVGIAGMLQDAALAAGKPALTVEISGLYIWEEASVRAAVTGILNMMVYLDMIEGEIEAQTEVWTHDEPFTSCHHLLASSGGIVEPLVPLGERVARGQAVAHVRDLYGNVVETISSPADGWVITYQHAGNRSVSSGEQVVFIYGT